MSIIDKKEIDEIMKESEGEKAVSLKYEYHDIDDFDDNEKTETDEAYGGEDEKLKSDIGGVIVRLTVYAAFLIILIIGLTVNSGYKKCKYEINALITESEFEEREQKGQTAYAYKIKFSYEYDDNIYEDNLAVIFSKETDKVEKGKDISLLIDPDKPEKYCCKLSKKKYYGNAKLLE